MNITAYEPKVPSLVATRYVTPLREGGSLPALVEVEGGALYVLKFAGAGQGIKALIAELVAGEIARVLGLRIPDLAFILVKPELGSAEPNTEIRELMQRSAGLNLGLRFLPNSLPYSPLLRPAPSGEEASAIVWFDAFITNVDRTPRNTNLLLHQGELWLIDHGASMYFQYARDWYSDLRGAGLPFGPIKEHVLLDAADALHDADASLGARLPAGVIQQIVRLIPDVWLSDGATPGVLREGYAAWLNARLAASAVFVAEAERVRSSRI